MIGEFNVSWPPFVSQGIFRAAAILDFDVVSLLAPIGRSLSLRSRHRVGD